MIQAHQPLLWKNTLPAICFRIAKKMILLSTILVLLVIWGCQEQKQDPVTEWFKTWDWEKRMFSDPIDLTETAPIEYYEITYIPKLQKVLKVIFTKKDQPGFIYRLTEDQSNEIVEYYTWNESVKQNKLTRVEYYSQFRKIKEEQYSNNQIHLEIHYAYNQEGLADYITYYSQNKMVYYDRSHFKEGKLVQIDRYEPKESPSVSTDSNHKPMDYLMQSTLYDEQSRKKQLTFFKIDGTIMNILHYHPEPIGKNESPIIQQDFFNGNKERIGYALLEYDSQGILIRKKIMDTRDRMVKSYLFNPDSSITYFNATHEKISEKTFESIPPYIR